MTVSVSGRDVRISKNLTDQIIELDPTMDKESAAYIADLVFTAMRKQLELGKKVRMRGLGTLYIHSYPRRVWTDWSGEKKITTGRRYHLRFKVADPFHRYIKKGLRIHKKETDDVR